MDGLSASKFSSKSHGGSVLPKEDGLDSSTITPGVRTAMPPFPPDSFRDNNETPNASVTGVGGGGGKASSRLESAMKREAHRKKGGSSWLDFFSFGRWRPGGGGRQQGAIQLAQSFGTPNQPGRPGPVIGVFVCKGPRNELQGLVVASPLALERFAFDGSLEKRAAPPQPLTCCRGGKIGGVGRVLLCGSQDGRVFIVDAENFELLLELNTREADGGERHVKEAAGAGHEAKRQNQAEADALGFSSEGPPFSSSLVVAEGAATAADTRDGEAASPGRASICSLSINCSVAEFAHFVIAGDASGRTFVWQVPSTKLLHTLHPPVRSSSPGKDKAESYPLLAELPPEGLCCGCCRDRRESALSPLNATTAFAGGRVTRSASREEAAIGGDAEFKASRGGGVGGSLNAVGSVAEMTDSEEDEGLGGAAGAECGRASCGSDFVDAAENAPLFQEAQWLQQAKPRRGKRRTGGAGSVVVKEEEEQNPRRGDDGDGVREDVDGDGAASERASEVADVLSLSSLHSGPVSATAELERSSSVEEDEGFAVAEALPYVKQSLEEFIMAQREFPGVVEVATPEKNPNSTSDDEQENNEQDSAAAAPSAPAQEESELSAGGSAEKAEEAVGGASAASALGEAVCGCAASGCCVLRGVSPCAFSKRQKALLERERASSVPYVGALLPLLHLDQLWVGYGDGALAVFSLRSFQRLHLSQMPHSDLNRIEYSKHRDLVLTVSANKSLTMLCPHSLQVVFEMDTGALVCGSPLSFLYLLEAPDAWDVQATLLLAGCIDGSICVRRLERDPVDGGVSCKLVRNYIREVDPQVPVSTILIDSWLNAAFVGDASGVVFTLPYVFQLLEAPAICSATD